MCTLLVKLDGELEYLLSCLDNFQAKKKQTIDRIGMCFPELICSMELTALSIQACDETAVVMLGGAHRPYFGSFLFGAYSSQQGSTFVDIFLFSRSHYPQWHTTEKVGLVTSQEIVVEDLSQGPSWECWPRDLNRCPTDRNRARTATAANILSSNTFLWCSNINASIKRDIFQYLLLPLTRW